MAPASRLRLCNATVRRAPKVENRRRDAGATRGRFHLGAGKAGVFLRAVIQRVSRARVTVDGRVVGEIHAGLLILLGVSRTDNPDAALYLAEKISNLRIFADEEGKMNRSVLESSWLRAGGLAIHAIRGCSRRAAAILHASRAPNRS